MESSNHLHNDNEEHGNHMEPAKWEIGIDNTEVDTEEEYSNYSRFVVQRLLLEMKTNEKNETGNHKKGSEKNNDVMEHEI